MSGQAVLADSNRFLQTGVNVSGARLRLFGHVKRAESGYIGRRMLIKSKEMIP